MAGVNVLITGLLDKGYDQAADATLRAISASTSSGIVAQRLTELDAEAARLKDEGKKLQADNPVLRALLADMQPVMRANSRRLNDAAPAVQGQAVDAAGQLTRQLALPGMDDRQLQVIGVNWNSPDPEAVNSLVGYVQSPAWSQHLSDYEQDVVDTIFNQAVRGIAEGWSPLRSARAIRDMTENFPLAQANTLMRTVQLESYRSATAIHQQANADILDGQIRVGTLDDRICMACLALHGEILPAGVRIQDHHNGRCTAVSLVRGRPREVQTGPQWFATLEETRQREIAGHANFEAMKAGRVQIADFVQRYDDPVFNEMLREASLSGILGDGAKEFYQ